MTARTGGAVAFSTSTPAGNSGAGSAGTSSTAARADHVHPSQTGVLLPSAKWAPITRSENGTTTLTKNREYCVGLDLAPQRIAKFAFGVTTVENPSTLRVGVRNDLNLQPGTVAHEEALTVTATGWTQTSNWAYDHPGGLLWLSFVGQGWTTTAMVLRGNTDYLEGFTRPWAFDPAIGFSTGITYTFGYQDSVSASLPSTFVVSNGVRAFEIYVQRA